MKYCIYPAKIQNNHYWTTQLKKLEECKLLNECGSQSLQMALKGSDNAFGKFFKK